MKILLYLFIISFIFSVSLYSQSNSIVLKTSGGTVISQHSSIQEAYNAITSPVTQAYVIEILSN